MRNKGLIIVITALMVLAASNMVHAQPANTWIHDISSHGSSFTSLVDGRLEFILMDGWILTRTDNYEYIISKNVDDEIKELGGIEVLPRGINNSASKIFTNLKDSGGSYILIEEDLTELADHSIYLIKWIKDKKYYVDIYILDAGAASYHISLTSELKDLDKVYQQFQDFIATIDIRNAPIDTHLKGYYNNVDKYKIHLPIGWQQDNSSEFALTTFTKPDAGKLFVYKQELRGVSPDTYIEYSNKKISEGAADVQLINRDERQEGDVRIVEYIWTRPGIKSIKQDFNYYWEVNMIPEGKDYVFTFIVKTNDKNMQQTFEAYNTILSTFTEKDYNISKTVTNKGPETESMAVQLEGSETKFSIPENKTLWGIFSEHIPGNYLYHLKNTEASLRHRFDFVMTYSSFDTEFPEKDAGEMYADGRVMMLTLHPWSEGNTDRIMIPDIVSGNYDEYIKRWADKVKELDEPVLFRFANEMNGDWDPWCAWFYGKDQDLFIQAWRRIYNIFEDMGADNVYFVWNPHDRSFPDFNWNNPHLYYPGDEYVDWIGLTGYNNGRSYDWDVWRDFDTIYNDIYNEYLMLYPDKPFIITEFASNEAGGNKAEWIRDTFRKLAYGYPRIKIAVWFNQVDGRWEYPIDSSVESKAAFINGLKLNRFDFEAIKK